MLQWLLETPQLKIVKGQELSTKDDLFVVRSFPGAKTDDVESYIMPTLKNKPECIIIHCGTNDQKNNTARSIADNIFIVPKKDHLDKKGKEVNINFKKRCNEMNLAFVSHGNIRTRYHCNYDGLHLNNKGATLFTENIISALNKVA